jgi:protein TonB
MRKEPFAISLLFHALAIGTLAVIASIPGQFTPPQLIEFLQRSAKLVAPPPVVRRMPASADPGKRGGGNRSPLPVANGVVPKGAARAFRLPSMRDTPRLATPQIGFEDAPTIASGPIGMPNGTGPTGSLGRGLYGLGGPGDVGQGLGDGPSGSGRGGFPKPSKWPQLVSKTEPEYSDSARKARHQGSVLLAVTVDAKGNPQDIRVIRGLGLGLDERAMEAVSTWRFRPALLNGKPVAAPITVEVNFRLL